MRVLRVSRVSASSGVSLSVRCRSAAEIPTSPFLLYITRLGTPLSHDLKRHLCANNSQSHICSRDLLPASAFVIRLPVQVPRGSSVNTPSATKPTPPTSIPSAPRQLRLLQPLLLKSESHPRPLRVSHVLRPIFRKLSHLYLQNIFKMQPLLSPAVSPTHTAIVWPRFYVRVP